MDISTTQQTAPAPATAGTSPRAQTASALSSDFETFLKMLTAQLQNQDPLNPLESTDFAVQLATFSGVEQQVRTNELLGQLAGGGTGDRLGDLASWIGQDVRVAAPAEFGGMPITLYPDRVDGAERTALVVRDAAGALVSSAPVPNDGAPIEWAGVRDDGSPLPAGTYSFAIEGYTGTAFAGSGDVSHYAQVREVRITPDGPRIGLAGDVDIDPDSVLAIRTPAPPPAG